MNVERLYEEIVRDLERRADAEKAKKEMRYHKKVGAGFKAYGLSATEFYELARKHQGPFKQLCFHERAELARNFFRSGYGGQMSFGVILLKLSVEEMKPEDFAVLEVAGDCLNNWGTVDGFCIDVLQPLLFAYPKEVLEILNKWNKADSLWKRRASVVVFTRKVGESGRFTDEALKLCNNLIWDREDYVRKGVGWALKDNMRGNKQKVLQFVKELRRKRVSAVITLYAIRDIHGKERNEILSKTPI